MNQRHPSSIEFHRILKKMAETHDKKQADYGKADDPFANVRASADFGVQGWIGCMIRANDKMARIKTAAMQVLAGGQVKLANESLEDSLLDLANYAVIGLCLLRQEQADGGTQTTAPEPPDKRQRHIEAINEQRAALAWAEHAHAALSASATGDAGDADDGAHAQAGGPETGLDDAAVHDRAGQGGAGSDAAGRPGNPQSFASWIRSQRR